MGWCDDPNSKKYNKLINLPFNFKYEKFFKKENTYDIILVLNYNMDPIRKNKGSAIFIHVAKKETRLQKIYLQLSIEKESLNQKKVKGVLKERKIN